MIKKLDSAPKIESVTPDGVRVETLAGNYTPLAVSEKIKMLFSNETIQKQVNDILNHYGLTTDQVSGVNFLATLTSEQLQDISSVIGDIKFHFSAGTSIDNELIAKLAKKLAA